ncbi:bifunctional 5,10-methylenetetrahydrofolate dehydrogenase/5,10-methenyltetrahydrofolate cyclohydrolase [Candidatus Jorgensenbacteria bacterium]|nr:bifunctional 5,10-methylenetetrahydrofolate dehydrogenase/5,10-methenyltetrahydrofolate cyclohydrolase [Candidatus Jorgensenbacteria bacterium]
MVIDGKKLAEEIIADFKTKETYSSAGRFLGAVLVGEDTSSVSFLKQKEKVAKEINIDFRLYRFPEDSTQDFLRKEVLSIAKHKTCGGIIVQLPLPSHINTQYVLNAIPREKDIDVLGERALGAFYVGRNPVLPPAAGVVQKILKNFYEGELNSAKTIVIGRGLLVGKPIRTWLEDRVVELTVFTSQTENIKSKLNDADIVISGAGQAKLFSAHDVKSSALVIDFGYSSIGGKLCGDFDPQEQDIEAVRYTPTPGGTGPMLVAQLFENFFTLNKE